MRPDPVEVVACVCAAARERGRHAIRDADAVIVGCNGAFPAGCNLSGTVSDPTGGS
jgi:hypothetical protein